MNALQQSQRSRFRSIKDAVVSRLRGPVLDDKILRSDQLYLEGIGRIVICGIKAIKNFIECVVCRNRQTGFAPQSPMHVQKISFFDPALKIIPDLRQAVIGLDFSKSLYLFVNAG